MALSWLRAVMLNLSQMASSQGANGLTTPHQVFMLTSIVVYMCFSGTRTALTRAALSLIHALQVKGLSVLVHGLCRAIVILRQTHYG